VDQIWGILLFLAEVMQKINLQVCYWPILNYTDDVHKSAYYTKLDLPRSHQSLLFGKRVCQGLSSKVSGSK